jgi:hypothetical protein
MALLLDFLLGLSESMMVPGLVLPLALSSGGAWDETHLQLAERMAMPSAKM